MLNVLKFLFFFLFSGNPLDIFFDSEAPGPQFFGTSTNPYQNFDDFTDFAQNSTNFHLKFVNSIYNCSKMANLTSNWTFSNFSVSASFSQLKMFGNCEFFLNNNTLLIFEQFDLKMENSAFFFLGWNSKLIMKNCKISCFFIDSTFIFSLINSAEVFLIKTQISVNLDNSSIFKIGENSKIFIFGAFVLGNLTKNSIFIDGGRNNGVLRIYDSVFKAVFIGEGCIFIKISGFLQIFMKFDVFSVFEINGKNSQLLFFENCSKILMNSLIFNDFSSFSLKNLFEFFSVGSFFLKMTQISSINSLTPLFFLFNIQNLLIFNFSLKNSNLNKGLWLSASNLYLNTAIFSNLTNSTSIFLSDVGFSFLKDVTIMNTLSFLGTPGLYIDSQVDIISYIIDCLFSQNTAFYAPTAVLTGTAIAFGSDNSDMIVKNCTFIQNSLISTQVNSIRYGGACLSMPNGFNSYLTVVSSIFLSNTAQYFSSALFLVGHQLNIQDCLFKNNTPYYNSYDFTVYAQNPTVFSEIIEMKTGTFGGAVYIEGRVLSIGNCRFSLNSAFEGGAVYISMIEKGFLSESQFSNNSASWGGAIFFSKYMDKARFDINHSYFSSNSGRQGGAFMTYFSNSFLIVANSLFSYNKAQQGGVTVAAHTKGAYLMRNNTLYNNLAPSIPNKVSTYIAGGFGTAGTDSTWILFSNNSHVKCFAFIAAGVGGLLNGRYLGINERFLGNSAGSKGGTIIIEEFGVFVLINSTITDSQSSLRAGVAEIAADSQMLLRNVNVSGGISGLGGGFSVSLSSNLTVENCNFMGGYATRGGLLSGLENGHAWFINCRIANFSGDSSIIDVADLTVVLVNLSIWNITTGVLTLENSFGTVNGTMIMNVSIDSQDYPTFYLEQKSTLLVANSLISNVGVSGSQKILVLYAEYSVIRLEGFEVQKVWANEVSAGEKVLMRFTQTDVSMVRCGFLSRLDVVSGDRLVKILMINVTFIDNENTTANLIDIMNNNDNDNGFVSLLNCEDVVLKNSNFINGVANKGGGLKLDFSGKSAANEALIENCLFIDNNGFYGGGIAVLEAKALFFNCLFIRNYATFSGGAVYIEFGSESLENDKIFFDNCSFINNSAESGGAIRWLYQQPSIIPCENDTTPENCSIFQNNAAKYGKNIASYPIRVYCEIFDKQTQTKLFDSRINSTFTFLEAASGQLLSKNLLFTYIDIYNQTIDTLAPSLEVIKVSSQGELMTLLNKRLMTKTSRKLDSNMKPFLTGQSASLVLGTINFSSITIFSPPQNQLFLSFSSTQIPLFSLFLRNSTSTFEINSSNTYSFLVPVYTRQCQPGEILISQVQTCSECKPGYFSFNFSDLECTKCPANADCPGGRVVNPLAGFWSSSENSSIIHRCITEGNCLGGRVCIEQFEGPLCESCITGFLRVSSSSCTDCVSQFLSIVRIILGISMLIAVLVMLIKSSLENMRVINRLLVNKDWLDEKEIWNFMDFQNIYMKILINNMQVMAILNQIDVVWPDFVNNFLDVLQYFTELSTKFMAFECVYEEKTNNIETVYIKLMVTNFVPFGMVVLIVLYWNFTHLVFLRSKQNLLQKIYTTIIGLFVMLQPSIISQNVNVLNCMELDPGVRVLRTVPKVDCRAEDHTFFANYLAIPSFFIWAFVWPLSICLYLIVKRKRLYSGAVFGRFSFFFIGYRLKFFYWDFVIMFRKVLLIVLMTFSGFNLMSKLYIVLFIYGTGFLAQLLLQPFATVAFNKLETISFLNGITSIFLAFLIVLLESDTAKVLIYVVILLINIVFIIVWTGYYLSYSLKLYAKVFRNRFPKQYELLYTFLKKTSSSLTRRNNLFRKLASIARSSDSKIEGKKSELNISEIIIGSIARKLWGRGKKKVESTINLAPKRIWVAG